MTAEKGEGKQMERREVSQRFPDKMKGQRKPCEFIFKSHFGGLRLNEKTIPCRASLLGPVQEYTSPSMCLTVLSAVFNTTVDFVTCDEDYFYS